MTMNEHSRPLAPGEIRIHWIGDTSYQVMHVAGGSFTQASVRERGKPSQVLKTSMHEREAVDAYAEAIEQAEAGASTHRDPMVGSSHGAFMTQAEADTEETDREDGPMFFGAAGNLVIPGATPAICSPRDCDRPDECILTDVAGPAPTLADDVAALRLWLDHTAEGDGVDYALGLFDRIAGAVPQRATDADEYSKGDSLWLHACGGVMPGEGSHEPDECPRHWCNGGEWQALYTLGEVR
jgi:hypothetical protein